MTAPLILSDPEIMGGTPCIRGTRLTVYAVAARLYGGDTLAELIDDHPHLTVEEIASAADYAARIPFVEDLDGRPWRKTKMRIPAE